MRIDVWEHRKTGSPGFCQVSSPLLASLDTMCIMWLFGAVDESFVGSPFRYGE